jgi:hypothetical protein
MELIPFTLPEINRIFNNIISPIVLTVETAWIWSIWRRRHQAMARFYHYRTRGHAV